MVLGTKEGLLLIILIFYAVVFSVLGLIPTDYFISVEDVVEVNLYEKEILGSQQLEENKDFTWFDAMKVADVTNTNPITTGAKAYDEVQEKVNSGEGFFATIIINLSNAPAVLNIILFTPLFIVLMYILISILPFFGS